MNTPLTNHDRPFAQQSATADTSSIAGLNSAEKYERLAFTFCKMGTVGLIAWLVTPPVFVLAVALVAIYLCGRAVAMGITRSQCVLRRPLLIMGFWAAVAAADATWLLVMR